MARISRDNTSWRAYGLSKRYEDWENNPKHKPVRGKNKRKNTKRWCRGKEGQEHNYRFVQKYSFLFIKRCTRCHKESWSDAQWLR